MKAQEYKNTIENLRKAREEAVISISEKEKLKEAEKISRDIIPEKFITISLRDL